MNLYSKDVNLAMLTDLYELTMMQGYHYYKKDLDVVFDMFFRRQPFNGGYTIFAGLEPLIKAVLNFKFTDDDLSYLKSLKLFKPDFLQFLKNFKFTGDIYSVEEGEVIFPNETLIRVHANIMEAQLLESLLLNIINFQTLIATKTSRVVDASKGRGIMEFGLRRAQGIDGAISATRAGIIGGISSTSNVLAGKLFDFPVAGTMAHSWIMSFENELEAFQKYAKLYPESTVFLVDTYNSLDKGIPAAIKVMHKLKKQGIKQYGIRLDSGDLDYLSKQARKKLDKAGLKNAKIIVSNELNEDIIDHLIKNRAPIDLFGVGTRLVTAHGDPSLSGVYKLVARKEGSHYIPSIKVSNNPEKMTNPGIKNVLRIYNDGLIIGDLIALESERKNLEQSARKKDPLVLYHPEYDHKCIKITGYSKVKFLLKNIIKKGELNYKFPSLKKIHLTGKKNMKELHYTHKRLLNPHIYKVSVTKKLMDLKMSLMEKYD
ncbi:MAG: nicotinate phosphoribosyltransferase [Spirochaetes bacterium]|nr:nicotinate phosphoribosyltransferase [Spirochaetota bacterium]